jgi:hypothetical protein
VNRSEISRDWTAPRLGPLAACLLVLLALTLGLGCRTSREPPLGAPPIPPIGSGTLAAPAASATDVRAPAASSAAAPTAASTPAPTVAPTAPPAPPEAPVPPFAIAGSAFARPDPGPGRFACGDASCIAGRETCAPREACGSDWPAKACVATAKVKSWTFGDAKPGTTCKDGCFSWYDYKACDGPSDCKTGQICCYDRHRIIGPCGDGEDGSLDVFECRPAKKAGGPCRTAEICSASDSKCSRPGSRCVIDPKTGLGACMVPRRALPRCGAAPCAPPLACMANRTDQKRFCTNDPAGHADQAELIECDRGRDCAPDESCFEAYAGRRCDLNARSWAGDDLPICDDASDCLAFCGGSGDAVCAPGGEVKVCECRPPCRRDKDCADGRYCFAVSLRRTGGSLMMNEPFCNAVEQRCDCRVPGEVVSP